MGVGKKIIHTASYMFLNNAHLFVCRPIAWVVTSEIFPLSVRSAAVSLTTAANWIGNFIVAMLTPVLIASSLQIHGTFYILSGALLVAFFFVLFSLPETKVSRLMFYVSVVISFVCVGREFGKN